MPFRNALSIGLLVVAAAVTARDGRAQEWTRFRGPNGSGRSETVLPAQWSETDFEWKAPIPGEGHSSPVVWGDRVFLLSSDRATATRYALCLSARDGSTLWSNEFPSVRHTLHIRSSYASSTPTVDDERVYFAWSAPEETMLIAFFHDGREAWKVNLGRWVSQHGYGTSPILHGDLLIVNNSQDGNDGEKKLKPDEVPGDSFVLAFDRKTGRELWRARRASNVVSYAVPCIRESSPGKAEVVCLSTNEGVYALDLLTGRENWSVPKAFTMRTVSSPVLAADHVFGTTGSGGGGNYVVAVKPGTGADIAFEVRKQAPYVPTPLPSGDSVFLWSDGGVVTCIDARSGATRFAGRAHDGDFSGSPILAGDKIYCVSDDGVLVCIAASDTELKVLGKTTLGEASRSTPAVSGSRMFLRTYSHVMCVGPKSS
ncbi:MAG: hypothetical protein FJ297_01585 [Planctomycetes bacterium]|nr:hypothetical protein [Planctomycetota bacterium]